MARVTVEDCLEHVNNRFELVLLAARRARQLARGRVDAEVEWKDDKSTVVALREIAAGKVNQETVEEIETQNHTQVAQEQTEEQGETVNNG